MIDISSLSKEDISELTKYFLEHRIIKFKDILSPIEEYFWKLDFNVETQSHELYLGVPKIWAHDMNMRSYSIALVSETGSGKIIKLFNDSDEFAADIDELLLFSIDIIERNNAILAKIQEKELELKAMKDKMISIQMQLDVEIQSLKNIKHEGTNEGETEGVSEGVKIVEEQRTTMAADDAHRLDLLLHGKS